MTKAQKPGKPVSSERATARRAVGKDGGGEEEGPLRRAVETAEAG